MTRIVSFANTTKLASIITYGTIVSTSTACTQEQGSTHMARFFHNNARIAKFESLASRYNLAKPSIKAKYHNIAHLALIPQNHHQQHPTNRARIISSAQHSLDKTRKCCNKTILLSKQSSSAMESILTVFYSQAKTIPVYIYTCHYFFGNLNSPSHCHPTPRFNHWRLHLYTVLCLARSWVVGVLTLWLGTVPKAITSRDLNKILKRAKEHAFSNPLDSTPALTALGPDWEIQTSKSDEWFRWDSPRTRSVSAWRSSFPRLEGLSNTTAGCDYNGGDDYDYMMNNKNDYLNYQIRKTLKTVSVENLIVKHEDDYVLI
ncbi:hypothetical protein BGX26_000094 [Mortierella sp. AD094]|nr:hypothetical protein BGX26_000094 [Mortierella sp. AD094]